jgi:hypothetical protein
MKKKFNTISRRSFCAGLPASLAGLAYASPLWSQLLTRSAGAQVNTTQFFIWWYTADGNVADWFWPANPGPINIRSDRSNDLSGTSFNETLPQADRPDFLLQPLAAYSQNMILMRGLNSRTNDHTPAVRAAFTGGHDTSLDTVVSHAIAKPDSVERILRLGVYGNQVTYNGAWTPSLDDGSWVTPSWRPTQDAQRVLDALGPTNDEDPGLDTQRLSRVAALGHVNTHLSDLACVAGNEARNRAEAFLSEVERLEALETQPSETNRDSQLPAIDPSDPTLTSAESELSGLVDIVPLMRDLTVLSLATGYTQTAGLILGASGANLISNDTLTDYRYDRIPHLEYPGAGDHFLSHPGDQAFGSHEMTAEVSTRDRTRVHRWYFDQLRRLLDDLRSVPYGSGTIFDHTTVVAFSEFSGPPANRYSGQHDSNNLPFLMIAGDNTPFRTGNYHPAGTGSLRDYLSTIAQGYGATMGGSTISAMLKG